MANIWARKSLAQLKEEAGASEHSFKRTLSALNLVNLGIGAIIGTGIFVLTGKVAAQNAGPALVISFIISGLACAFAGLCYAEFASMIPIAGSAYTYSYATVGELFAWIIGWDLIIEYLFAASTVSVGWSGYVVSFLNKTLGLNFPAALSQSPIKFVETPGSHFGSFVSTGAICNLPAMLVIFVITLLLIWGVQESARFNNIIVAVKVTVVLLFIIFGISYVNTANWQPFIPANTGKYGEFGWSGISQGAAVIFFAYIGFDAVSTAAQEAKNPQRDLPIGILGSLAVCTILYITVALVLTGIVSYKQLNVPDPMAVALDAVPNLKWLAPWIKIGAIAGLSSVMLVMLLGQPRIFFTMAKDGLLPPVFAKVHPKFKTPYISSIMTGIVAMIAGGFLPLDILSELVSIGTLLAFTLVCLAVIILRRTDPNAPRPFKTPLMPVVPILGMVACLYQMYALPFGTWIRLFVWLALGMAIYFFYGIRNSRVQGRAAKEA